MILTRTPYRMSFFGGGTDYPAWFREHGGQVLTCTIDRYCYITVRPISPFVDTKYRLFWSHIERVNSRDDIKHRGIKKCLEFMMIDQGVEVNHSGDLPARSGLGSSSAFTVGMLNALYAMSGTHLPANALAALAIHVEQEVLKETVGVQDQIECAYGGMNHIEIRPSGDFHVHPISISFERKMELQSHLMLFYTGQQRYASDIAETQNKNVNKNKNELQSLAGLVTLAINVVYHGNIIDFGLLLDETWKLKKSLSAMISNSEIDEIYFKARKSGAIGGKLLGAGAGGFLLIFCSPDYQRSVRNALAGLVEVPVRLEDSGSKVLVSQ